MIENLPTSPLLTSLLRVLSSESSSTPHLVSEVSFLGFGTSCGALLGQRGRTTTTRGFFSDHTLLERLLVKGEREKIQEHRRTSTRACCKCDNTSHGTKNYLSCQLLPRPCPDCGQQDTGESTALSCLDKCGFQTWLHLKQHLARSKHHWKVPQSLDSEMEHPTNPGHDEHLTFLRDPKDANAPRPWSEIF
ncbi:uncharacterized protein LOC143266907 [Peromyscus maniculatus bairdii]|uniref:uncharacterized protein LOC143266907 n=1 Tax=Peromyscus maniculatus bairdii TaxID=230844 RepID=UPI003FD2DAA8